MTQQTLNANKILLAVADAVAELSELMSAVNESKVNTIPYEGSWTAAQLLRHVTKSIDGMTMAMNKDATPAERDPEEKAAQLKKIFLDFSRKLTPPEFIIPEEGVYEKQTSINELNTSFDRFRESASDVNLYGLIEGVPLSPITKLEIIHFVLYHTQRHLNQMKNICEALKNK
ncbi:DinB family protein [Ferruginibacter sp. SUN002]|uniref:DinB family protein n=1 Tax=Ferruginibacter sp. SUN002 TaxID=2937789 RepID=UPI003D368F0D